VLGDSKANRKATAYINTATGWTEEPRYALSIDFGENPILAEALQLMDFTADGAPDALVCVAGWNSSANCRVLANLCPKGPDSAVTTCFADSGQSAFPTHTHSIDHGDLGVRLVDLNADGRIDALLGRQQSNGTSIRRAWIWDGSNWTPADQLAPPLDFVSERAEWGATASRNGDLGVRIGDLNGDRLPDLSVNDPLPTGQPLGAVPCNQTRCVSAFLLIGQAWVRSSDYEAPLGPASAETAAEFWAAYADLNGDGLDDLVTFSFTNRESHAYLNTGAGLVEAAAYAIPQEMFGQDKRDVAVRLLDVNADGLPDLVRASRQPDGSLLRMAYLNSGGGWLPAAKEYAPDRALSDFASGDLGSKLIDVDGNGNPDLLFGLDSAVGDTAQRITIGNLNQRAGLLWKIADRLGSVSSLSYAAALTLRPRQTALAPETTDASSGYPQIPLNAPAWLVAATKVEVAGRGAITRQFAFGGFAIDVRRGVPVGPSWRRVVDDNAGSSVETHFLHSARLEGLVGSESTFDVSGLRSATRNSYSITAPSGCSIPNQPDACYDVLPLETVSTDFDAKARPAFSSKQHYDYDSLGNVTRSIVEYYSLRNSVPRVERRTTIENNFTNDLASWRLGRLTHSRVTNWSSDSSPVITESEFEYDAGTGLIRSERANSHTPNSFKRVFQRDLFGNILVSALEAGKAVRTEYSRQYDAKGRFVTKTCNALNQCESYERLPFDGRATRIRDANAEVTSLVYDDVGRTIEVIKDGSRLVTEYRAASGSESSSASFARITRLNGGDARAALFDGAGGLVRLSKPGYKGRQIVETAIYDGDGLLREKTEPAYSGDYARRWSYQYDAFGGLSSVQAPNGFTTLYEARGQSIAKSTAAGPVATQDFSVDRKMEKTVDALGRAISFHYDAAGRQDRITLANGSASVIKYDDAGHKSEVRDPDRGLTRYEWNEFSELKEVRSANGVSISMEYDAIGRLVKRRSPDKVTEWIYDRGRGAIGQISEVRDNHGYVEKREYDLQGRVSQVQYLINGERFLENFEYSSEGALLAYRSPNAVTTAYKYDKNGFVETVSLPESRRTVWTAVSYSPDGRVTEARLGDNLRTITQLSPKTGLVSRLAMESNGRAIDDVTYETNPAGYVVARKDVIASELDEFSYDAVGQLTGWKQNGAVTESYEYDNLGNIKGQSQNGAIEYPDQAQFPHRAATAHVRDRAIPIRYDGAGRAVSFGDASIEYASDGLPAKISSPRLGKTEMRRDPNGNVVSERTRRGLAEIEVVHIGRFERIHVRGMSPFLPSGEEYTYRNYLVTPSGVVGYIESTNWVFGRARPTIIDEPFGGESARAIGVTSRLRFAQTDLLGSQRLIVDERGSVVDRLYFSPWGVRQFPKGRGANGAQNRIDYSAAFGGYSNAGADDMLRAGPRLYSPLLGRFLRPTLFRHAAWILELILIPTCSRGIAR